MKPSKNPEIVALAKQLFGFNTESNDTTLGMARTVGTAIVDDLISQRNQLRRRSGRDGFLCLCPSREDQRPVWESPVNLKNKIDMAVKIGDFAMARALKDLLQTFESHDDRTHCLIAVAGMHQGAMPYLRAYLIPTDNPQANLMDTLRAAMDS